MFLTFLLMFFISSKLKSNREIQVFVLKVFEKLSTNIIFILYCFIFYIIICFLSDFLQDKDPNGTNGYEVVIKRLKDGKKLCDAFSEFLKQRWIFID